jgi:DNA-binding MarR family transcriptional regulator
MNGGLKDALLRIEDLLRAMLRASASDKLTEIRADATLRQIYDMTGENLTVSQIAKRIGISTGKVSGIWKSWEEAGLLTKQGKSYRKLIA